jgi:hypothetical protein
MRKPARSRANNGIAMPSPPVDSSPSSPVHTNDVARRAFELYSSHGCQDGHDLDDWLMAEGELQATPKSSSL